MSGEKEERNWESKRSAVEPQSFYWQEMTVRPLPLGPKKISNIEVDLHELKIVINHTLKRIHEKSPDCLSETNQIRYMMRLYEDKILEDKDKFQKSIQEVARLQEQIADSSQKYEIARRQCILLENEIMRIQKTQAVFKYQPSARIAYLSPNSKIDKSRLQVKGSGSIQAQTQSPDRLILAEFEARQAGYAEIGSLIRLKIERFLTEIQQIPIPQDAQALLEKFMAEIIHLPSSVAARYRKHGNFTSEQKRLDQIGKIKVLEHSPYSRKRSISPFERSPETKTNG